MYMEIRLPLACLIITAYCYFYYAKKKRLRTMTARAFDLLGCVSLIHLLAATVTEYTVNHRSEVPVWFNESWHLIFYISVTLFCGAVLEYLMLYVERGTGQNLMSLKKVVWTFCGACCVLELFLPGYYVDTPYGSHAYGPKAFILYGMVAVTLSTMIYLLLRFHTLLSKSYNRVLISTILLCISIPTLQILRPTLLLTDFLLTIVSLGLMVNTEDAHLYLSYPSNLYNELACKTLLQELLFLQQPFYLGVYVFLDNGGDAIAAMQSVQRQLPEKEAHTTCCMLSNNVLVVLPMRGLARAHVLPSMLPPPDSSENCPYTLERLQFSGEETVEDALKQLWDVKFRYQEDALHRDELTGLLRREAFSRQVTQLLEDRCGFTFLMLDLDDFKSINDNFGHATGDEALKLVAYALRMVLRTSDRIGRLGGDEFAVVLYGVTQQTRVQEIVNRLQNKLADEPLVPNDSLRIKLSIGARICPPDESELTFRSIYNQADQALYQAKRNGKHQLAFFENP